MWITANRGKDRTSSGLSELFLNQSKQFAISIDRFELGEALGHIGRSVEKKTCIRFAQHRCIVERISRRDDAVVHRPERRNRFLFLLGNPNLVIYNPVVFDNQPVAKQGWPVKSFHQRRGELLKRVRKNYNLGDGS